MCLFCTAVPMTASLSIAARCEWKEKRRKAESLGQPTPTFTGHLVRTAFGMAGMFTATLLVVLLVGAIIYHTTILPRTGV